MSLDGQIQLLVARIRTQFNTLKGVVDGKEPALPAGGTVAQYLRGDKTWRTLATDAEPPLPGGGTVSQYLRGDKTWADYIQSTNAGFVNSVSTANHALTGLQTVGGVAIGAGGRVLLVAQTDAKENGIWIVGSGAWARATDANTSARLAGYVATVSQGANISTAWRTTFKPTDVIGTNNIRFYRTAVEMVGGPLNYPNPAMDGHLIFDKTNRMPRYYDAVGVQWLSGNGVVQDTKANRLAAGFPVVNTIWRETDTGDTWVWDGTAWQQIGYGGSLTTLHRCHVRRAVAQTLTSASSTTISWDTEVEDTSNMWDATAPTVVTAPTAGRYLVVAAGSGSGTTASPNMIQILVNAGAVNGGVLSRHAYSSNQPTKASGSLVLTLAAGDTVALSVYNTGTSPVTGTGVYDCELMLIKLPDSQVVVSRQVQAACQIHKGAGASAQAAVASNTTTQVTFDSVRYDTDGMADTANNRIVIQHDGIYRLNGVLAWATNATGIRTTAIYLNGVEVAVGRQNPSSSGGTYGILATITLDLNIGDVITLMGSQLQSPTATLALANDTAYRCWLSADIVSDTVF